MPNVHETAPHYWIPHYHGDFPDLPVGDMRIGTTFLVRALLFCDALLLYSRNLARVHSHHTRNTKTV